MEKTKAKNPRANHRQALAAARKLERMKERKKAKSLRKKEEKRVDSVIKSVLNLVDQVKETTEPK